MDRVWLAAIAVLASSAASAPAAAPGITLPASWTLRQTFGSDSWTWTMTSRGANAWNGHARHDRTGEQSDWTFVLAKAEGNRVWLRRDGAGTYAGTISPDGRSINGTCDFIGGTWTAAFAAPVMAPAAAPPPSAPVSSPLPASWIMRQTVGPDSWTWTMTSRGTNVWTGRARQDRTGEQSDWTFTLTRVEGNRVWLQRAGAGAYIGTISADGRSMTGTCDFIGGSWTATLRGSAPAPATPPAAATPGADLGATIVVVHPSVCTGIWTRVRPGVYDSNTICQGPRNPAMHETLTVEAFDGRTVTIARPGYGRFRGTLSPDRKTIRGTCDWPGCTAGYRWTGYIDWNWNDSPPLR